MRGMNRKAKCARSWRLWICRALDKFGGIVGEAEERVGGMETIVSLVTSPMGRRTPTAVMMSKGKTA